MLNEIKAQADQKMHKSLETLKNTLGKIRTGRAHIGLIDHVTVDYYGTETPINQVANVTLMDARTIGVQPYEKKMLQAVEKAIRDSDLGLNPSSFGDVVRIPMPALTEERRRDLTKIVRSECEEGRVAIRNVRRDALAQMKELLKGKEISEDDERRAADDVQKLTDKAVAEVDRLMAGKEAEVMAV